MAMTPCVTPCVGKPQGGFPLRRPFPPRQGGFSLIEVLVAFTILALLLGTLLQIFARGLMAARLSDEYTRAVLLAESLLAELSSRGELAVGTESGALEGYRWTNRIAPYQPAGEEAEAGELPIAPQDLPMLPLVAVAEVAWGEGPEHRSVTLTTLLSGPTQETGFGKEPTREIPSPDSGNRSSR